VSDDIRALTARVADEPTSLAFLELAEALRRRGQLEAAGKVARGGLSRYPGLADAHDLMARILSDQGDLAGAFDAWADALRLDPMRIGALKGIAFLYFRAGDAAAAIEHLQRAAEVDPDDITIAQALAKVRRESRAMPSTPPVPEVVQEGEAAPSDPVLAKARAVEELPPAESSSAEASPVVEWPSPVEPPAVETHAAPMAPVSQPRPTAAVPRGEAPEPDSPFATLDGGHAVVLVDANGLLLAGSLTTIEGDERGDRVAAELAGVSREASRAARLLGLGPWHSITLECPDAHVVLVPPTGETVLLAARERSLPIARVALLAERAAREAKSWLERVR
jgi:predicted regulator of Ras-like GTPase activity (Roadblock/LC7/MglB family)/thioredoxin-like negative regulator of GroEL